MKRNKGRGAHSSERTSVFKRQTSHSKCSLSYLVADNLFIISKAFFLIYKMANINIHFARLVKIKCLKMQKLLLHKWHITGFKMVAIITVLKSNVKSWSKDGGHLVCNSHMNLR